MSPVKLQKELEEDVSAFFDDLDQGRLVGSLPVSLATVKLIKRLIGQAPWNNAQDLMDLLRDRLGTCDEDDPARAVIGNLVRRVLRLVREEHGGAVANTNATSTEDQESLHRMMQSHSIEDGLRADELHHSVPGLKAKVLESIDELMSELEAAAEEISNQALEHIHANEVILTVGRSRTVELFLKQAAKGRKFQVIVAEAGPPGFQGQEMAVSLAKAGIQTTVITDSAIFAIMSRVNKVIVGTAAILADGGLKAATGTYTAALSAKHYSVPLYVCASIAKLTPRYCTPSDLGAFNSFASPEGSMSGMDGDLPSKVSSVTPVYEYVPPDLVTLFISNLSGHAPSYVYRLLSELYNPKDYDLSSRD